MPRSVPKGKRKGQLWNVDYGTGYRTRKHVVSLSSFSTPREDHKRPFVALLPPTLFNGLLDQQGKYDEAESLYHQALAVFERTYGPEHYEVAVTLNNLAALAQAQGNPGKAEHLYGRALRIKEKVLGPAHPDVATTLNNLAALYHAQGQYAQAAPLYQRALTIFEEVLGPAHPTVVTCQTNCAKLLRQMERD
jgi:tetratricopeptide (TPR) repeat protein